DFLRKLATPKLRHLTLKDCDFDDDCANALATSTTFANLTRLTIDQGYDATKLLSPEAAERMFRSDNLQRLVELKFDKLAIGQAVEALADESIMPKLGKGSFWGSNPPRETIERLKRARPIIHLGS